MIMKNDKVRKMDLKVVLYSKNCLSVVLTYKMVIMVPMIVNFDTRWTLSPRLALRFTKEENNYKLAPYPRHSTVA